MSNKRHVYVSNETKETLDKLGITSLSKLIKAAAWLASESPSVLDLIKGDIELQTNKAGE